MKALILRHDVRAAVATSQALMDKGFQVFCAESQRVAHALIRVDTYDLLIMDERIDGQLTHAVALSGERRNPYLSAILLTDRAQSDTDDLYALIPSLYALAGSTTSANVLAKLALSAVSGFDAIAARIAAAEAMDDIAEEVLEDEPEVAVAQLPEAAPAPDEDAETEDLADVLVLGDAVAVPDDTPVVALPSFLSSARATHLTPPAPNGPEVAEQPERVEKVVLQQVAAMFAQRAMDEKGMLRAQSRKA